MGDLGSIPETALSPNREILQDEPDPNSIIGIGQPESRSGQAANQVPGKHATGLRLGDWHSLRFLVVWLVTTVVAREPGLAEELLLGHAIFHQVYSLELGVKSSLGIIIGRDFVLKAILREAVLVGHRRERLLVRHICVLWMSWLWVGANLHRDGVRAEGSRRLERGSLVRTSLEFKLRGC